MKRLSLIRTEVKEKQEKWMFFVRHSRLPYLPNQRQLVTQNDNNCDPKLQVPEGGITLHSRSNDLLKNHNFTECLLREHL